MTQSPDHEARISRLEARMEEVAAARHLASAHDRDLADLGVKVDAHRAAINALGAQTRERFDRLEGRFDRLEGRFDRLEGRFDRLEGRFDQLETKVDAGFATMRARLAEHDRGFAEMRHGFDQTAAGFAHLAELITARDDDR